MGVPTAVKKFEHVFKSAKVLSDRQLAGVLQDNDQLLEAFRLILKNTVVAETVQLPARLRNRLQLHSDSIRVIVDPTQSIADKREVLNVPFVRALCLVGAHIIEHQ